jgi:hypothetical protein
MWLLPCLLAAGGAGDGSAPAGGDQRDAWSVLDLSIDALAPVRADDGLVWGLLLRAFATHSSDDASDGTDDVSGTTLEDVDLFFQWKGLHVGWRVSADFDDGDARLEDAYARWSHADWLELAAGQLKPRVLRSGSVPDDGLLLRERTFLGAAFDLWDDGVAVGGHADQFDYWLTLTDGANGRESDHAWTARGEWALYDAAFEDREGARGAPDHLRLLLGAAAFADVSQSSSDGGGFGFDLALTFGPYAFHAEWADLDEEFARTIDVYNGRLLTLGDGQPFSATLSRRVGAHGEAVLRAQHADDADDTGALTAGAGWTPQGGPARFVADVTLVEDDVRDFSIVSVGVQLGSSGLVRPFGPGW